MRNGRGVAWVTGMILLMTGVPASPSMGDVQKLAGITVIRGTKPAVISVRLPRAATVEAPDNDSSPDLQVRGKGRFVGFALVPERDGVPVLFGGRLPKETGSLRVVIPILGQTFSNGIFQFYENPVRLPAGNYRLYLLPDSGSAEVTLRFRGLSGRTQLRPTRRVAYKLVDPPIYSPTALRNYYSAGMERQLKGEGLIFQAVWLHTQAHADGFFHFCHNEGELPPEVAYAPGCGGSGGGLTQDRRLSTEPQFKLFYEGVAPLGRGTYGQGFYFATASVVENIGHLSLWLGF